MAQDYTWEDYRKTLDPAERWEILCGLEQSKEVSQEEAQLQKTLFAKRYTRQNGMWMEVPDLYVRFMLEMMSPRSMLATAASVQKQVLKDTDALGFPEAEAAGELGRAALLREWENAFLRYLSTTEGDRYGSKLFGLLKASAEEKEIRIQKDIRAMTDDPIQKYHLDAADPLRQRMQIYRAAAVKAAK